MYNKIKNRYQICTLDLNNKHVPRRIQSPEILFFLPKIWCTRVRIEIIYFIKL